MAQVTIFWTHEIEDYFRRKLGEPLEIGGLLLTVERGDRVYFPLCVVPKQKRSPASFVFDPAAQHAICEEARATLGDYCFSLIHTHPSFGAFLSGIDEAQMPAVAYSIVMGGRPESPQIRLFKRVRGISRELSFSRGRMSFDTMMRELDPSGQLRQRVREFVKRMFILVDEGLVMDVIVPPGLRREMLASGLGLARDLANKVLESIMPIIRAEIARQLRPAERPPAPEEKGIEEAAGSLARALCSFARSLAQEQSALTARRLEEGPLAELQGILRAHGERLDSLEKALSVEVVREALKLLEEARDTGREVLRRLSEVAKGIDELSGRLERVREVASDYTRALLSSMAYYKAEAPAELAEEVGPELGRRYPGLEVATWFEVDSRGLRYEPLHAYASILLPWPEVHEVVVKGQERGFLVLEVVKRGALRRRKLLALYAPEPEALVDVVRKFVTVRGLRTLIGPAEAHGARGAREEKAAEAAPEEAAQEGPEGAEPEGQQA